MLKMSLIFLSIMVPVQVLLGDLHGVNTLEYQPAKLAAMEGLWETRSHVPASLFAIPDQEAETNHFEIAIPLLGSLYLTHALDVEVKGLKAFPREDRPPVAIVYFAFRVMVGIGLLMLLVVVLGWLALRRGGVMNGRSRWLRLAQWSMSIGFIAVLAGWTTTEVGRQPWVVYGLMRTKDAVTPSLTTGDVALSLTAYVLAYLVIFGGGFVLLRRMVRRGPEMAQSHEDYEETQTRSARPLSAVSDAHEAARAGATQGAGDAA
jgi:cytochrome d ubiquinol oxidase subunit I